MRIKIVTACAALLAAIPAAQTVVRADNPKYIESITVKGGGVRGWTGDYVLTFNAPVSLPGLSLAPGKYIFRQPVANVIQVSSASGTPYKMFNTLPVERKDASSTFTVQLGEPTVEGAPMRILAVFAPGERNGRQLIYPSR